MGRLLLLTGLAALLLLEASRAAPQGPSKTREDGPPEQDTEGAWGARGEAHPAGLLRPEDGSPLLQLLPGLRLLAAGQEGQEGASALEEAKDILAHLRSPVLGPEPDLDHRYHPASPEAQEQEDPRPQELLVRQVLQGPEEDRDHIYHASEGSPFSQGEQ